MLNLIRKSLFIIKNLRHVIKKVGGINRAVLYAKTYYKREGLLGVKNGFLQAVRSIRSKNGLHLEREKGAHLVEDPNLRALLDYPEVELAPSTNQFCPKSLNVHWVIPDFSPGAGGHMTIFRVIKYLENFGHKCTIWINHPSIHQTEEEAKEDLVTHFQDIVGNVKFIDSSFSNAEGDIIVATDWGTVSYVCSVKNFKRRFYFVQDHEPEFFPQGSYAISAKNTYSRDIDTICASPWLKSLMETKYDRWATEFWLAVDNSVYYPTVNRPKNKKVKIAFYARHFTSRRAVELGLLAFEALANSGIEFELHAFGANLDSDSAPFDCVDHGVLSVNELANLYRSCDLGVVFSTTNYSLIPQEMMACGLPVAEFDTESTRAIFPHEVATLLPPCPIKMSEGLQDLIFDHEKRNRQAENALHWVSQFSWDEAAKTTEKAFLSRLLENGFEPVDTNVVSSGPKVSIIIPTLNGGEVFKRVIEAIKKQKTPWPIEVVVVDSGSTDGTIEFLKLEEHIQLHHINKSDFQHGRTRNYAISKTRGELIAVITQDAMPASEYWLYNLVSPLEVDPQVAGVFGKHYAWPEADPFTKRDLENHFRQFDLANKVVSKDTDPTRWKNRDQRWRQFLHFYSDNNSCMRRCVWKEIPYPEIEFGEDQAWACKIIERGYKKAYSKDAVVYHSHDFDEGDTEKRAYEEAKFFLSEFGYELVDKTRKDEIIKNLNASDRKWATKNNVENSILERRIVSNEMRINGYVRAQKC